MADLERHCRDCERLLGDGHEAVHQWMDQEFGKHGADHRRFRHHSRGVDEADELFGREAARAAVAHIVRDCGRVPRERDYYRAHDFRIEVAPASMAPGGEDAWWDEFEKKVKEEWGRIFGVQLVGGAQS